MEHITSLLVLESQDLEKLSFLPMQPVVLMDIFGSRDKVYDNYDQALALAVTTGPGSQSVRGMDVDRHVMEGQEKQNEGAQSLRSKSES